MINLFKLKSQTENIFNTLVKINKLQTIAWNFNSNEYKI